MGKNDIEALMELITDENRKRRWRKIVIALACIVVFCTTYALILPVITMSGDGWCGYEDHTHTESCYNKQLVCEEPLTESHSHTDTCIKKESVLTCEEEETEGHQHTESCISMETVLLCGAEESDSHVHEEMCYEQREVTICEKDVVSGHQHMESCYDTVENYVCNQEETEGHAHLDTCYAEHLICEKEEHSHELICFSNPEADLESAAIWEGTLPGEDRMTGIWSKDLLTIAESQIGYEESQKNYVVNDDDTINGYTRYGQWYGIPYGDWCAMFASFCLDYADIPEKAVPQDANCDTWIEQLKAKNLYRTAIGPEGGYIPKPGDLIFLDWNDDSAPNHVGLVASIDEEKEELTTIEGNTGNDVVEHKVYDYDDSMIMGYGLIPIQHFDCGIEDHKHALDCYSEFSVDGLKAPVSEQTEHSVTAQIYTDKTYAEHAAEDTTVITVSGMLPKDAVVKAYAVYPDEKYHSICAYDIEIFDADGKEFEPNNDEISVVIQSKAIDEELNTQDGYPEVYYVPDDGEPEWIESDALNGGVAFKTNHFSVYMVTRAVATEVNTARALTNAVNRGDSAIMLTGNISSATALTLPANSNITIDLNGYVLTYTGTQPLFTVGTGETLTIMDSGTEGSGNARETIDYTVTESEVVDAGIGQTVETKVEYTANVYGIVKGGSAAVINNAGGTVNIESGGITGCTNSAITQSAGTLNLNGGYLYGNTSQTNGGAVRASGGTINQEGAIIANNSASANGGGISATAAKVNIDGGVISGNTSLWESGSGENSTHHGGGGLYVGGSSEVNMTGGYITNNRALANGYFDGGGGALVSGTTQFNLSGGYITGNAANSGGGIRTDWKNAAIVTMSGGYVCSNTALTAEGGGICINMYGTGNIVGGYINNNTTGTDQHWGGGGLFCSNGSNLYIMNAMITQNHAGGYGGGVAGCSTGRVYICIKEGGAIFDNTDEGKNMSGDDSTKGEDHTYAKNSEVFNANGHKDYFCALSSMVEGTMLGGYSANWDGSADGEHVTAGKGETLISAYVMGLEAKPSTEGIAAAKEVAQVYINGNTSNTHGGGILANGYLIIGIPDPAEITVPARVELTGSKALLDGSAEPQGLKDGQFEFELVNEATGAVIATAKNDKNGVITFAERIPFIEAGVYRYILREKDSPDETVTMDTSQYRMTYTVERREVGSIEVPGIDGEIIEVKKYQNRIVSVKVEKRNDSSGDWEELYTRAPGVSEDSAIKFSITDEATFTNYIVDHTKISVVKNWTGEGNHPDSIVVGLYQNGNLYDKKVTLSTANQWKYTWEEVPLTDASGKRYAYEVKEDPVEGYIPEYQVHNTHEKSVYWIPAEELKAGEKYILVSSGSPAYALAVTQAHIDAAYTSADKEEVTPRSQLVLNGKTYSTYFENSDIVAQSVYEAVYDETVEKFKGITLQNRTMASAILVENNGLKGGTGIDAGYITIFDLINGNLVGYDKWGDKNNGTPFTVVYSGGKFTAVNNTSGTVSGAVKVYTRKEIITASETVFTINNKKSDEITYSIDLTKVSSEGNDIFLKGAKFQLKQNDAALYFRKTSEGAYVLSNRNTQGATIELVTAAKGKLVISGLPAGNYTLTETEAPEGYRLAEPVNVTLGEDGTSETIKLTVVDPRKGNFVLPETGGSGTTPYTIGGLLLMIAATAFFLSYKSKKYGKEDITSS